MEYSQKIVSSKHNLKFDNEYKNKKERIDSEKILPYKHNLEFNNEKNKRERNGDNILFENKNILEIENNYCVMCNKLLNGFWVEYRDNPNHKYCNYHYDCYKNLLNKQAICTNNSVCKNRIFSPFSLEDNPNHMNIFPVVCLPYREVILH